MGKIGIVGTGWGARVQVPTFREAGLDVVAIAGFHADKTRKTAQELGVRAHEQWRELASDDWASVDLRLRDGGVASLELCAVSSGPDEPSVLTIHGDGGAMRFI